MKTTQEITNEIIAIAKNPDNHFYLDYEKGILNLVEQFQKDLKNEFGTCGYCGKFPKDASDLLCRKCR